MFHEYRRQKKWTHSDVRCTLDNEAVGETVEANGAALLIQVDLLFGQEVSNSAAGTKPRRQKDRIQNPGWSQRTDVSHVVRKQQNKFYE